jgi:hypothetical protein
MSAGRRRATSAARLPGEGLLRGCLPLLPGCTADTPAHSPAHRPDFIETTVLMPSLSSSTAMPSPLLWLCRDFGGPPPQQAQRASQRDERPDILCMSYEEYVERFQQVKLLQGGSGGTAGGGGKENGVAEEQPQAAAARPAGAAAGGEGGAEAAAAGAGGGAGTNPATMSEEEYVQYCQRYACYTACCHRSAAGISCHKTVQRACRAAFSVGTAGPHVG